MRKDPHMKPLLLSVAVTLSAAAQQDLFLQAEQAYAQEQYPTAIQHYQSLLADGFTQPEINYNLGNAAFKAGDLPLAIKHYRRAQYDAPSDPDIDANLRFALEDSGATLPEQPLLQRLAFQLPHHHWLLLTLTLYALLLLTLFLRLFAPRLKPKTKPLLFLLLTALLISAYALRTHHQRHRLPEQIVLQPDTPIHFAPLESSTIAFSLPAGTILQPTQTHQQAWLQIRINDQVGWVQRNKLSSI